MLEFAYVANHKWYEFMNTIACHACQTAFYSTPLYPLTFLVFLLLFHDITSVLEWMSLLGARTQATTLSTLASYESLQWLLSMAKQLFWPRWRTSQVYEYKHKYWEDNRTTWPLSKTQHSVMVVLNVNLSQIRVLWGLSPARRTVLIILIMNTLIMNYIIW